MAETKSRKRVAVGLGVASLAAACASCTGLPAREPIQTIVEGRVLEVREVDVFIGDVEVMLDGYIVDRRDAPGTRISVLTSHTGSCAAAPDGRTYRFSMIRRRLPVAVHRGEDQVWAPDYEAVSCARSQA